MERGRHEALVMFPGYVLGSPGAVGACLSLTRILGVCQLYLSLVDLIKPYIKKFLYAFRCMLQRYVCILLYYYLFLGCKSVFLNANIVV